MLFAHGALYLLRTPFGAMLPWSPTGNQVFDSVWMTVLSFEALLFTIAIAFILLAMAKERTEHRHKTAALIDPLTGIANRRAFLQDGEAQLKRQAADPRPIAVMLLDLDNFKSINDRFGHAVGDRVLQMFAEVASGCMRRARPVRPARRRGIRRGPVRCHAGAGAGDRRANPHVLCRGDAARSTAARSPRR